MGDEGIIVIAVAHHDPEQWTSLVRSNPLAKILEVRLGEARPGAARARVEASTRVRKAADARRWIRAFMTFPSRFSLEA